MCYKEDFMVYQLDLTKTSTYILPRRSSFIQDEVKQVQRHRQLLKPFTLRCSLLHYGVISTSKECTGPIAASQCSCLPMFMTIYKAAIATALVSPCPEEDRKV